MTTPRDSHLGLVYALSAFLLWGLAPVYFKLVEAASAFEVLSHRIVWSVVILAVVVSLKSGWQRLGSLRWPTLRALIASALLISTNWLTFIWAVTQDRVLETSMGYFINPLISVLLGMLFLQERLRPIQWLAIGLAAAGIGNQIAWVGYLPWVTLVLAFSFGFYGLIRKQVDIDPINGLFVETLVLFPLAMAYMSWLGFNDTLVFGHRSAGMDVLLMAAGLVTTIPLLLFAAGARRLSLTVLGFTQYTTPSMTFLLAIFVYQEPFDLRQLLTFVLIWAGLLIFTTESVIQRRRSAGLAS